MNEENSINISEDTEGFETFETVEEDSLTTEIDMAYQHAVHEIWFSALFGLLVGYIAIKGLLEGLR